MNELCNNKILAIITSAALLSAVISCVYAHRIKSKAKDEILNALQCCRRVREQTVLPHPTKSDLRKVTNDGCRSIAYQIDNNTYSDDYFGNHSRECAMLILKSLAENMREGENLAEYFARKNMDEEYYAESEDYLE